VPKLIKFCPSMYLNSIPMISSLKMDSTLKQDMLRAANDGHRSCQEYEVEQFYHSEIIAPVRVVCVGSGISGLCLAHKMMERLSSFELTIFEKNEDIGGT
jgi:cation diffusion facilitator CzcD-associated flavoprotein CzcO